MQYSDKKNLLTESAMRSRLFSASVDEFRGHLCPEMHATAKMAKDRQRAGNSNWLPKVAPLESGDFGENDNLAKMTKNHQAPW